jgi:hypothetical protein
VFAVRLLGRSKIHGDAVLDDFVLLENLIQDVQRPSAVDHEIFRNDLKPVDNRLARENMVVVGSTQANSYTVICKPIKPISWHIFFSCYPEGLRARRSFPALVPAVVVPRLLRGWLGAIGRATALALARVLAFATVVAGLAAALALAGVLAFTSVLFFDLLVTLLVLVLILRAERSL